ncbi:YdeI/OmpD-associated family protein [Chitinibacteraceae bacterium HSL-7]
MSDLIASLTFVAPLRRPAKQTDALHAFVLLPKPISDQLSRRGRVTVDAMLNDTTLRVMLEPDGQLSHWLPLTAEQLEAAEAAIGVPATVTISPLEQEPEPALPADLAQALAAQPKAQATWRDTTPIAQLDWIHWVTSAKQAKTRAQRVANACDMLASGKKRVCCFDPSGFYSKALSAPKTAD